MLEIQIASELFSSFLCCLKSDFQVILHYKKMIDCIISNVVRVETKDSYSLIGVCQQLLQCKQRLLEFGCGVGF